MHTNRKSSSSSSSEERLPRRSNSFGGHNKRSLVASLTHVIPTNKQSSLDLSSSSAPASEIPYIAQDSNAEIHDLALFRPSYGGVNISAVWENCTMRGWMTKHIPPSYSFTKTKKQRYVILADRMLYTFKTETPTSHYREFFELTKDTSVFVTDYITGVMYCIEVTKLAGEKKSWYLQCETAEHMKMWLDRLKKTVAWLRDDKLRKRVVTNQYEWDNASVNSRMSVPPSHHHPHQTSSSAPLHPSSIPPQQPPPRSAPPPPPISSSSTTAMHFQKFEF
ncbi:hypothetical protein BDB00DRAFT_762919 [Zychaea mexicana]|uniref:uncharacterized protein n=1 Tax=Zychaea mexicana TaxID=64656 RepID=UPI0022FECBEE|nr:uncharacterized protein BDB00DRAFT_762919 [Zychaea mexicana]KAI9493945.1 hypothetical protein BDB00DRAFT_762919 [Zychaea mexicana]